MKNNSFLGNVESVMWNCMERNRNTQGGVNFMSYFFVLYAYRHQYSLEFETYKNETTLQYVSPSDDDTFNMLYTISSKGEFTDFYEFQDVAHFYNEIRKISPKRFNEIYPDLIESLIERMALSGKRLDTEFVQPKDLTDVVCHILKKHHSQDIYNPYSGLSSYAIGMKDADRYNSYYGRDINERLVILSRLRMDAHNMNDTATVECANVLHYWPVDFRKFDTVVATPPFGVRVLDNSFGNKIPKSRTIEDSVLWHCLDDTEGCKTAVVVVPTSFLSRRDSSALNLRKTLCDRKVLEMVIDLPGNIFYGTGIATSILVLNFASQKDCITFIDAKDAVIGKGQNIRLDSEAINGIIDGKNTGNTTMVPFHETYNHDCMLIPSLYENIHIQLSEGERLCRMKDLMEETRGERVEDLGQCNVLSQSDFSSDLFKVIHKEDVVALSDTPMSVRKIHGPHLVLSMVDGKIALYMHKGDTDFYVRGHHMAIKPNTDIVNPEYLAYLLLMSDWAKMLTKFMMGTHLQRINMLQFGNMKMGVLELSRQVEFLVKLEEGHKKELAQIHQAELNRLGFRDVYSDVIHMLGTPFHKQAQVVKLLKKTSKEDEKYSQRVKALMDISMYIQRVIDLVGKDFTNTQPDLDNVDLSDFIIEYQQAWSNFASGAYRMKWEVSADGSPMTIHADKDLLMILMDTLSDNAKRHAFVSGSTPDDNLVNISLQHVVYNGKPCVLLSVCNNGEPLEEGFTIQDYITRGRFSGKNGRTGLGGNHVYTIVKKHGGWLNIRSDKSWGFIVDMLFPMGNQINDDFIDYEYEAI